MLEVPPGFEAAAAALFDDELTAPLIEQPGDAPRGWMSLPPLAGPAALPEGPEPRAGQIGAPPALFRRLTQAGLVANEAEGWALQARLAAGQSLVDRDVQAVALGRGLRAPHRAPAALPNSLRQRNRALSRFPRK